MKLISINYLQHSFIPLFHDGEVSLAISLKSTSKDARTFKVVKSFAFHRFAFELFQDFNCCGKENYATFLENNQLTHLATKQLGKSFSASCHESCEKLAANLVRDCQ